MAHTKVVSISSHRKNCSPPETPPLPPQAQINTAPTEYPISKDMRERIKSIHAAMANINDLMSELRQITTEDKKKGASNAG